MRELLLKKRKYLKFPEDLSKISEYSPKIEKISLHNCSNCQILLDEEHWPNLKYIEMIGCKYFSFSMFYPSKSPLEQIYFSYIDTMDILDIVGNFPSWRRWLIENSKFLKFKGDILGDNHLELLHLINTKQSILFIGKTVLNYLISIQLIQNCHFCTVDLQSLQAGKLAQLWFKDSHYLNINSLGKNSAHIQSFKFENCNYPKLNVDFSELNKGSLESSQAVESYISKLVKQLQFPFRKAISPVTKSQSIQSESNISPKLQEDLLDNRSFEEKADEFSVKYCPECGERNLVAAKFCRGCGNPFPF